jgi:DNA polymerase-3 subunit alpha
MKSTISLLKFFSGRVPVILYNEDEKKTKVLERDCWINLSDTVISELKERLGDENVKLVN